MSTNTSRNSLLDSPSGEKCHTLNVSNIFERIARGVTEFRGSPSRHDGRRSDVGVDIILWQAGRLDVLVVLDRSLQTNKANVVLDVGRVVVLVGVPLVGLDHVSVARTLDIVVAQAGLEYIKEKYVRTILY